MDRESTAFRFGGFFLSAAVHQNGLRGGSQAENEIFFRTLFASDISVCCQTVPIEVRCILGGVEVSKRLISMPFDHIAYTGKHLGVAFGKQRITVPNEKAGPKVARV